MFPVALMPLSQTEYNHFSLRHTRETFTTWETNKKTNGMPLPLGGSDHRKDSRLEKQHVDSITSELGDWSDFVLIPWSALATWNKHSWTVFWSSFQGYPTCQVLVMCQVPDMKDGQVGCPWKGFSKYRSGLHWGGTQNWGKGRYLSKTLFLIFVYLSKILIRNVT